jgi:WhiB family redox-sensing transcriptional regulator
MMRNQAWRDKAACHGLPPDWFFPPQPKGDSSYDEGKRVCATCSVTEQCLGLTTDFIATGDRYGLFGGMTPAERRFARRVQLNVVLWREE